MAQKYNPLLKFGLQEIGGGGGGEAEQIAALQAAVSALQTQAATLQTAINTLKSNKITKCFTVSDLAALELNEIFEWQGETTENLTNGYFYKISSLGKKIMPGDNYIHIVNDVFGGLIKSGDYYPIAQSTDYISGRVFCRYPQNGNYYGYCLPSNNYRPVVGDILFDFAAKNAYRVVSVENNTCTLENGDVVNIDSISYQNPTIPTICNSVNNLSIVAAPLVSNPTNRLPLVVLLEPYIIPLVLEPYTEWQLKTAETEIVFPPVYDSVNVQPSLEWGTIEDYDCLVANVLDEGVSYHVEIPYAYSFKSPTVWRDVNFVSGVTLLNYSGARYLGLKYFRVELRSANDIPPYGKLADCADLANNYGGFALIAYDNTYPPVYVSLSRGSFSVSSSPLKKDVTYSGVFILFADSVN